MHRFKIIAETVIYSAEEATPVTHAYICDAIRTPIGRFAGSLSSVRADDLAAVPIRSLLERNSTVDWEALDDVFYGCANQAGEDNRNVGRMAALLAGLPASVPATTIVCVDQASTRSHRRLALFAAASVSWPSLAASKA